MRTIDDDTQVMRGEFVETITAHPLWVSLVEEFEQASCQQLLGTKAHEVKKRESIFNTFDGARTFLDYLRSLVRAKYEILESRAIEQEDALEEDELTDNDAYR